MAVAVVEKAMTKSMMQCLITIANLFDPTNQEITDSLGLASTNGVRKNIAKLLDLGYLVKLPLDFRAIRVSKRGKELLFQLGAGA